MTHLAWHCIGTLKLRLVCLPQLPHRLGQRSVAASTSKQNKAARNPQENDRKGHTLFQIQRTEGQPSSTCLSIVRTTTEMHQGYIESYWARIFDCSKFMIHAGNDATEIECDLEQLRLDTRPDYYALNNVCCSISASMMPPSIYK